MKKSDEQEARRKQEEVIASEIIKAIRSIKYGHVLVTIHDSKVVQVEKTEKIRLRRARECIC